MAEGEGAGGDDLRARLDTLGRTLDAGRPPPDEDGAGRRAGGDPSLAGAMGLGFRVLTEFVAGIAVGALIGWLGDRWLHTSPVLLIVFLTLGTAAGFWNVYRLAAKPTVGGP